MIPHPFGLTPFLQILHAHFIIQHDLNKRQIPSLPLLPPPTTSAQNPHWEINFQDEQQSHLMACELAGCQEACERLGLFEI